MTCMARNGGQRPNVLDAEEMSLYARTLSLQLADPEKREKVEKLLEGIKLNADTVRKIWDVFESELELGLEKDPKTKSSLPMVNTYLTKLPDKTEEGLFLALDLGGTNFRVLLLELKSGYVIREEVKYYNMPDVIRTGSGLQLFDFLAACIHDFLCDKGLLGKRLALGFTFSFPMMQRGLDVGILQAWTKSFNCEGVVGKDAVHMLNDAIHRRGDYNVHVVSILNDTTGTLVQGHYQDPQCTIGLILGTGTNACYMERVDRLHKWEGPKYGAEEVAVNTEWGAFGDNGVLAFIKTEYDKEVDKNSLFIGSNTFEKYISGKYLGEVVRIILVKLTAEGLIFGGTASERLLQQGAISSSFVAVVEQDSLMNMSENTTQILDQLSLNYDFDDLAIIKYVCFIVSKRAAILVSICLAILLQRMNRDETTIAVDGSLFKFHARMNHLIIKYTNQMVPNKKFKLLQAEDGSGKGAALVAAIAKKLQQDHISL